MKQEIDGVKQEMKQEIEKQNAEIKPELEKAWWRPGREVQLWSHFLIHQNVYFMSFNLYFIF